MFHVMNRSAKQLTLFERAVDYERYLQVLKEAETERPIRLLEYCVMPNHFHLLVWPRTDDELSAYMRWTTGTHGQRWRRANGTVGKGAVYQGRFRWVAVQDDRHYEIACRYIYENPVRAGLVGSVEDWPWSSASGCVPAVCPNLHPGPLANGLPRENRDVRLDGEAEERMRECLRRNRPFGDPGWAKTLEVRSWLTAVLKQHPDALKATDLENIKKNGSRRG